MVSKKARRHDGWISPIKTMIDEDGIEPQLFYDDWQDHRDGMRDYMSDKTKFKKIYFMWDDEIQEKFDRWNKKLKKLIRRRKLMKHKFI